ncbi:MAG: AraC family transcriptional regulator [Chitinophagaceae bacterium]|jgi:AraC-like DNA-binding protein
MQANTPILELGQSPVTLPFEIHSMAWIERNRHEQNNRPHRHNYFVLVWVRQGGGTHQVDLETMPLVAETVHCISPGQVHWLHADAATDGYVISFTSAFLGMDAENRELLEQIGLLHKFSKSIVVPVDAVCREEMNDIAKRMTKEFENYFLLRSEILRGYLKIFLIFLTRQIPPEQKPTVHGRGDELVQNFFALLDKHFASQKMVSDYANRLVVTPNYLNEVVKKATGQPASHHIYQRVMLEAKRLATFTRLSMKEIAYQLGFDDIAHFSKFFKKQAGESFSDFRKIGETGRRNEKSDS